MKYSQLASEDNFYYLGTWYAPLCGLSQDHVVEGFQDATRPVLLRCYAPHASKGCSSDLEKEWHEFEEIIETHYQAGHDTIMSDEMFVHHFEQADIERFAKILLPKWNVRILYTYRHLYSSIPSLYHQTNDPYATQIGMANAYEKTIWPRDGGFKIESFRLSNHFNVDTEMQKFQHWVDAFGKVDVFDMQMVKGGDYLPLFFCTMMTEVPSLCSQDLSSQETDEKPQERKDNDSSRKYLRYDMIAVQAHEEGLLAQTNKSRGEIRDRVQQYCENHGLKELADFPLDCLTSEEQAHFLDQSVRQAQLMGPYFVNGDREGKKNLKEEIRTGFAQFAQKKQFCSVDASKLVQQDHWRTFFSRL